jgi:O-antigen/teichoic acid export membrane protein
MVDLEAFGYYALATTMASMAINTVINSLSHAVYPRFTQFVSAGDGPGLSAFYHHACQIAAGALFPIMGVLAIFSREILMIWTGDPQISDNTATLLAMTSIGSGLNGLLWLPYFLQLAHGWTKLTLYTNIAAVCTLIPLMIYAVTHYGVIGGAAAWVALNVGYLVITPPLMHRRVLKGEQWQWYLRDLLPPLAVTIAIVGGGKLLLPMPAGHIEQVAVISVISLLVLAGSMLVTPAVRNYLTEWSRSSSSRLKLPT